MACNFKKCPVAGTLPLKVSSGVGKKPEVKGNIAMASHDALLPAAALHHRLPQLPVEEVPLLTATLEVVAQGALDAQSCADRFRAELEAEEVGEFATGHADAAEGEVEAPGLHGFLAEAFSFFHALEHPCKQADGVGVVLRHGGDARWDEGVEVVAAEGAQLMEHDREVERVARLRDGAQVFEVLAVEFVAVFAEVFDDDGAHVIGSEFAERDAEGLRVADVEGGEDFFRSGRIGGKKM